jgi:hypothetical protein
MTTFVLTIWFRATDWTVEVGVKTAAKYHTRHEATLRAMDYLNKLAILQLLIIPVCWQLNISFSYQVWKTHFFVRTFLYVRFRNKTDLQTQNSNNTKVDIEIPMVICTFVGFQMFYWITHYSSDPVVFIIQNMIFHSALDLCWIPLCTFILTKCRCIFSVYHLVLFVHQICIYHSNNSSRFSMRHKHYKFLFNYHNFSAYPFTIALFLLETPIQILWIWNFWNGDSWCDWQYLHF